VVNDSQTTSWKQVQIRESAVRKSREGNTYLEHGISNNSMVYRQCLRAMIAKKSCTTAVNGNQEDQD